MNRRFMLQGLAVWPALPALAVANGLAREAVLAPLLGAHVALPLSGVVFAVLVVLVAAALLAVTRAAYSGRDLWWLGAVWAGLALAFEFGVFGLVGGAPMGELLAALDPSTGNLFALVIAATLAGPRLAGWGLGLTARPRP